MEAFNPALEALARSMYEKLETPRPTWDQLGDNTKDVWRERAAGKNTWPFKFAIAREATVVREQPKPMTLAERLALKGLK